MLDTPDKVEPEEKAVHDFVQSIENWHANPDVESCHLLIRPQKTYKTSTSPQNNEVRKKYDLDKIVKAFNHLSKTKTNPAFKLENLIYGTALHLIYGAFLNSHYAAKLTVLEIGIFKSADMPGNFLINATVYSESSIDLNESKTIEINGKRLGMKQHVHGYIFRS